MSALGGVGLGPLLQLVESSLPAFPRDVTVLIPYGRDELVAMLYRDAEILTSEPCDEGTVVHARVGEREFSLIAGFVSQGEPVADRNRVP
jgi:GTP-binding protein HflX